ncbi:uncharacterized protein BO87DRAFT_24797 [Aspergillus neoniger CBS 115656]|uniref:Uncharacterized protein n=1 Tax=Aspergillus neoniger (strain CBS 115656) TaxID=1448310 RepID=A0A318YSS5_ASPNB|nr:hypothetical protein BO87DRAFT_24797 [Aspergillus neoniger CBS 115656]PYH35803.1 hypothetical protein BO87DRAFT_24797 [Aspergillus neoniger CBS 115656]
MLLVRYGYESRQRTALSAFRPAQGALFFHLGKEFLTVRTVPCEWPFCRVRVVALVNFPDPFPTLALFTMRDFSRRLLTLAIDESNSNNPSQSCYLLVGKSIGIVWPRPTEKKQKKIKRIDRRRQKERDTYIHTYIHNTHTHYQTLYVLIIGIFLLCTP